MNSLLNILNGYMQYNRGKESGITGLIAIGVVILISWQWQHILPILQALGIVGFFDRLGLIYNEDYMTGFAIFIFAFKLCVIFVVLSSILLVLAMLLITIFSNDKIAYYVCYPIFIILILVASPILLIVNLRKNSKYRMIREQNKNEKKPLNRLLEDFSQEISSEEACMRLNRIPTEGDNSFLLGKGKNGSLYVLIPRPLNLEINNLSYGELLTVEYKVEKYNEPIHKPKSQFDYVPKHFYITKFGRGATKRSIYSMSSFYDTSCEDMRRKFNDIILNDYFLNLVDESCKMYFEMKQSTLETIKNAEDKETFDRLVNRMSLFNAANEDIVKMMINSENNYI